MLAKYGEPTTETIEQAPTGSWAQGNGETRTLRWKLDDRVVEMDINNQIGYWMITHTMTSGGEDMPL